MGWRDVKWRAWFRAIHRDLGYVAVALTLAYALSGLAVNHIEDWNPNYRYSEREVSIGAVATPLPALAALEAQVVGALALDARSVRGHFLESAHDFRVFLTDGQEVRIDLRSGRGQHKHLARRAVLYEVNALHLNNLKGVWTYIADGFAIALIVLAITGLTMLKGDKGLVGRGKYFVGAGLLVPISFVAYLYSG